MDAERLQATAARDQLWASLRTLLPDVERIARGDADGSDRDRQLVLLLARIVMAEMQFRAEDKPEDLP